MKRGLCQYCGQTKALIKAHVISRTLFKAIFKEYGKVHYVKVKDLDEKNKVQDAFFDKFILCGDCDNSFAPYEDYLARFLAGEIRNDSISIREKIFTPDYDVDRYQGVNNHNLRMFFLILLWRCSISKQPPFRYIKIPHFEDEIRRQLKSGRLKSYDLFPVVVISVQGIDDIRTKTVFMPMVGQYENIPLFTFCINGWIFLYTFGNRLPLLSDHRIRENGPIDIVKFKDNETGLEFLDRMTNTRFRLKFSDVKDLTSNR